MRALVVMAILGLFVGQTVAMADGASRLQNLLKKASKKPAAAQAAAEESTPSGAIREEYAINAQYRGTVKKAYMDIGQAWVSLQLHGGNRFTVKSAGKVTDPENKGHTYELSIDADFKVEGNRIDRTADRSTFNADAEKHRERLLLDMPFFYIAKHTAYPSVTSKDTVWRLNSQDFTVRHVRTGGEIQFTILERGTMIGKFFLEPSEAIPHNIKKFRVMGGNDVVLSFVSKKYANTKD
jgi:hypothetical protein